MATRRPLILVDNAYKELSLTDGLILGRISNGSKEVDATNGLLSKDLTAQRTYLTGTAGLIGLLFNINLPTASAAIDGLVLTLMATAGRVLVAWNSPNANIVGLPSLTSGVPVSVQYDHGTGYWYKAN